MNSGSSWQRLAKSGFWFQSAAEARKYLKILIWPVQIYGHREDDERSEMAGVERKGRERKWMACLQPLIIYGFHKSDDQVRKFRYSKWNNHQVDSKNISSANDSCKRVCEPVNHFRTHLVSTRWLFVCLKSSTQAMTTACCGNLGEELNFGSISSLLRKYLSAK